MGKQGPCYHCGVTSTPLWRNGPPDKPVLCNACGSRWRTKGTLANYTPLHARDDYEDPRISKAMTISLKKREEKMKKRKVSYENTSLGRYATDYSQGFQIDEDTSNRSSSGSAVSNSESCAQFSADASDLTGPSQAVAWETQVPSKKRTDMSRPKPSPVEKLAQDLCAILHEQQSSYLSGISEEELLFESDKPMVSVEIGNGSVLIKHPSSLAREEESEASSLSVENKACVVNEAYSYSALLFGRNELKGESIHGHGSENFNNLNSQMIQQEPTKRDKSIHDRMQPLLNQDSPLCHIDLNDVINFDVLLEHLTSEEQQQLLKYLPFSDTSQFPGSLGSMFDSSFFKENLSSFQQLLSEGVFGDSCSGVKAGDLKTIKKLAVSNLTKSKWLELYKKLKDNRFLHDTGLSNYTGNAKRLHEELNQKMAEIETRATTLSPRRRLVRAEPATREPSDRNGSSLDSRSMLVRPTESQHLMLELPHHFGDESTDQDLLVDVPSNGFFPQAELLPVSSFSSHQTQRSVQSSTINPARNHELLS